MGGSGASGGSSAENGGGAGIGGDGSGGATDIDPDETNGDDGPDGSNGGSDPGEDGPSGAAGEPPIDDDDDPVVDPPDDMPDDDPAGDDDPAIDDPIPEEEIDLTGVAVRPAVPEGFGAGVTGGQGGQVVTARTGTEIHAAICARPADDTPLVIMVDGTVTPSNTLKQSGSCNTQNGLIELKEISNISLIGVGTNGVLDQTGIHIRSSSNIIIQNLTIKNVRKSNTDFPSNGGDAIGMESDVSQIWIDHNLIYGSTTEGEEHDGLIDMKANTTDVTISYNHIHTGGRGGLVGSSDSGGDGSTRITWHHNWYENLNSRTHLVREAHGHFYNNYYSDILSTGINCRNGASLRIEGNYFTRAKNPLGVFHYIENPGVWEVHDNIFTSSVLWEPDDEEIPAGPDVQSTGSVSVPYQYTLDPAEDVPAIVIVNAGVGKI